MTKIKELIKHKKRGITVEEDAKPSALVGKQVVLTIKHIGKEEPKVVEKPKKQKAPPTPLQKLSTQRNWDKMQAATAFKHIETLASKLAKDFRFQFIYQNGLKVMLQELHKAIDEDWERQKRAYLLAVEQEAFAKYPISFRGSPAEINKRLDIMKAQEEF